MANDKLYITISDSRNDGPGTPTPQPKGSDKEKENDTLGRYAEHQMFHLVKETAQKTVSFAISNIGNFTGDYIAQKNVNEAMQFISGVQNIGMSTLAGAKYGWVGAIVGFVVGTISQLSSGYFNYVENTVNTEKMNYNISQLRERAGLNTKVDGSRGTEN